MDSATVLLLLVAIIAFCVFKIIEMQETMVKYQAEMKAQSEKSAEKTAAALAILARRRSRSSDSSGSDNDDEELMAALQLAGIDASQVNLPRSSRGRRRARTVVQNITGPTTTENRNVDVKCQISLIPSPFGLGMGGGGAGLAGLAGLLSQSGSPYALRN